VASRQREISSVIGHGAALSESELTFTKGYPQRRTARLAAAMMTPPGIPQLTTAADVARKNISGFEQGTRNRRSAAESRPRIRKPGRMDDRYAEFRP
jgi:hypothetical protein